jgi:hypothetical protein
MAASESAAGLERAGERRMGKRTGGFGILGAVMAVLAMLIAGPALARGGPAAEHRVQPYRALLPGCEAQEVLGFVQGHFASREIGFWASGLQISGFDRVKQTAFRPWGPSFVPRRFCTARAHLNDRKVARVNYYVRETVGAFGNSWEVIWCVVGLDRHRTYAPGCEQATPWN